MTNDGLFCTIYVESALAREDLVVWLQTVVGGSIERRTLQSGVMEIDVVENVERTPPPDVLAEDTFLYFPFLLEIEPTTPSRTEFVGAVSILLDALWRDQGRAVAACAFEPELPHQGGISMLASSTRVDPG